MKKTIVIVTGTIVLLAAVIGIFNFNNIDLKFTILNNKQWDKNLLLDLVYSASHKREVYSYTFSEDAIKTSEKQYFPAINGYLPKEIFEEFGYTEEEIQNYGQVALYCKELKYKILVLDGWRAVEDNIY